jgi:hypothetical protein
MSKIKKSISEVELAYCKKYFKLHLIDKKTLLKSFFFLLRRKLKKLHFARIRFLLPRQAAARDHL